MSNSVATAADSPSSLATLTQADVPGMIEQFENQLKELKGTADPAVDLNVAFNNRRISAVTSVSELLQISSSVFAQAAAFETEKDRYLKNDKGVVEIEIAPFTISEKTLPEWEAIIRKAIFELINKQAISNLEEAISGLKEHLSEEMKLQDKLKKLQNLGKTPIK